MLGGEAQPMRHALQLRVVFKVIKAIGDVVVSEELEEEVVEFKGEWELPHQLVHGVEELQKDRSNVGRFGSIAAGLLAHPLVEGMTEEEPLLLHQSPETCNRAIGGVHHNLSQRNHLLGDRAGKAR